MLSKTKFVVGFATLLNLALMAPRASIGYTLNHIYLDDGRCGHPSALGADKTVTNTVRPSFIIDNDGGLAKYKMAVDGVDIGQFNSLGGDKTCSCAESFGRRAAFDQR